MVPKTIVKHEFSFTSYDNQEQKALDTLEPSTLVSWLDPEPDSLPLPVPKPYSGVTGDLRGVVFLGKEGSKTTFLDTELPHTVRLNDGVRGSISMFG